MPTAQPPSWSSTGSRPRCRPRTSPAGPPSADHRQADAVAGDRGADVDAAPRHSRSRSAPADRRAVPRASTWPISVMIPVNIGASLASGSLTCPCLDRPRTICARRQGGVATGPARHGRAGDSRKPRMHRDRRPCRNRPARHRGSSCFCKGRTGRSFDQLGRMLRARGARGLARRLQPGRPACSGATAASYIPFVDAQAALARHLRAADRRKRRHRYRALRRHPPDPRRGGRASRARGA